MDRARRDEIERKEREMTANAYWDGYDDARDEIEAPKRFRRNKIDGVLGGVCAGIADYTGIDVIWVRLLAIVLVFTTAPIAPLAYIIAWIVVPSDKRAPYYRQAREAVRSERRRERKRRNVHRAAATERRPSTNLTDVRSKFRSIEARMQDLERSITSKEWQLRRDFRDLEDK